ncbi:MAG: hypothetical protein VB021_06305 [Oscillospiraceae bacterium]|nr:hypothetical protein [Oscillospiraceae bacterium]
MRNDRDASDGVRLALWTAAHFFVDFCCFYILFGAFAPRADARTAMGFLLYNALAFGLQPIAGYYTDRRPERPVGPVGCAAVLAALLLRRFAWAALVLCALGNACFHAAGGRDALTRAGGRTAPSGIFVCSGAPGIYLGARAAALLPAWLPAASMLLCGGLLLRFCRAPRAPVTPALRAPSNLPAAAGILLAGAAVAVRAGGGTLLSQCPGAAAVTAAFLPTLCACAGKAAGGFLADRFGARRAAASALLLSLPLLCFARGPLQFCVGVALFNVPMAVTLCAIAARLPSNPGLSFGLSALALLCGVLPSYFIAAPAAARALPALLLSAAVCVMLTTTNTTMKGVEHEKESNR